MNRKNRDVEKQRYWQRTIGEAARSGMSIREFCRQRRVKESQFYWWQRKLKAGRQERNKPSVQDRAASFALVSEDGMDMPADWSRSEERRVGKESSCRGWWDRCMSSRQV